MSGDFFYISKSRWRAMLVLAGILCLIICGRIYLKYASPGLGYFKPEKKREVVLSIIELNSADSLQLVSLRGIGPVLAKRIIKYRSIIGGFDSIPQLKKVYGIKPETYSHILPRLTLVPPSGKKHDSRTTKEYNPVELNSADSTQLVSLPGIGPVLASRILKYRSLIGAYKSKEDLKKVYGIPPETLDKIEDLIFIIPSDNPGNSRWDSNWTKPQHSSKRDTFVPLFKKTKDPDLILNINFADSIDLLKIPGIGSKTASRIVKYRSKLHFFNSLDQIEEVFGISEESLVKIRKQLRLGEEPMENLKLSLNSISKEELGSHPYISYKEANMVIEYRERHGQYKSLDGLKKLYGLSPTTLAKMKPYLKLD